MGKPSIQRPDIPPHWTDVQPQRNSAVTDDVPWTVTDGGKAQASPPDLSRSQSRDINDSNAGTPSDSELGFDPNGPGQFRAILTHPLGAAAALGLSILAEEKAKDRYPNLPRGDNSRD